MFLAAGWARAATAHAIDPTWWTGEAIRRFVADSGERAVPGYGLLVESVVDRAAVQVAVIVLVVQLVVVLSLALDWHPLFGLGLGMMANLQFTLAGAVNPSIFYLILAAVIVAWRLEQTLSIEAARTLARSATAVCGVVLLLSASLIEDLHPDRVIEDPTVVLPFLSLLLTTTAWVAFARVDARERGDRGEAPTDETSWGAWPRRSNGAQDSKGPAPGARVLGSDLVAHVADHLPNRSAFRQVGGLYLPARSDGDLVELVELRADDGSGPMGEDADWVSDLPGEPEDLARPGELARPSHGPSEVVLEVERRTGYKFNAKLHAEAARRLGVRTPVGVESDTLDDRYAEWHPAIERYLYSRAWIDLLVLTMSTPGGFVALTGVQPSANEHSMAVAELVGFYPDGPPASDQLVRRVSYSSRGQ